MSWFEDECRRMFSDEKVPAEKQSFPLCRLPFLASSQVTRSFFLKDIFFLSLTSKKFRTFLKSNLPKNQVYLSIKSFDFASTRFTLKDGDDYLRLRGSRIGGAHGEGDDDGEYRYDFGHRWEEAVPKNYKFGDETLQVLNSVMPEIKIYWDDLYKGVRSLITHFSEAYNTPQITLILNHKFSSEQAVGILKLVKELKLPIRKVEVRIHFLSPEAATYILNECQKIQSLCFTHRRFPDFAYRPNSPDDFTLNHFLVQNGSWVQLEDFMQCRQVVVRNYRKENLASYLNEFFKRWMASDCRLERLEVRMRGQQVNFEDVVHGLRENEIQRVGNHQTLKVQKVDGKKAIIVCIVVRTIMQILLEPDNES